MVVNKTKKCWKCSLVLSLDDFHNNKYGTNGKNGICKKCNSESVINYVKKNKDKVSNWSSISSLRRKLELINQLGGVCVNCGINDIDVLNFDHINNNAKEDRMRGITSSVTVATYYLKHLDEAKKQLQILCANCNLKKELYRRTLERLERHNIPPF